MSTLFSPDKSSFEDTEKNSLKKQSERLQEELRSANQRIIELEECCDGKYQTVRRQRPCRI